VVYGFRVISFPDSAFRISLANRKTDQLMNIYWDHTTFVCGNRQSWIVCSSATYLHNITPQRWWKKVSDTFITFCPFRKEWINTDSGRWTSETVCPSLMRILFIGLCKQSITLQVQVSIMYLPTHLIYLQWMTLSFARGEYIMSFDFLCLV
jgi:hypothetical protein